MINTVGQQSKDASFNARQRRIYNEAAEMKTYGLDSHFVALSDAEKEAFRLAVNRVVLEAQNNRHKRPKVTTILEEFAEMVLSFRGKHDDPPELELVQVASVCINVLWQLETGVEVNNIVTNR